MDDHRDATPLTDETLERDLARAVAIDPSPEFVARVRMRIANEPAPGQSWLAALKGGATSGKWRRALALRWPLAAGGAVVAAAVVLAAVLIRPDRSGTPGTNTALSARAIGHDPALLPSGVSAFKRTAAARPSTGSGRADSTRARGEPVEPRARRDDAAPLFDARETRALQTLIAGVRDRRIDLAPLLRPGAPPPMELPPIDELSISPITIEPIAPADGAQGVRP